MKVADKPGQAHRLTDRLEFLDGLRTGERDAGLPDPPLVEILGDVRAFLEPRPLGDCPVWEQVLVMADARVLQPCRVGGQWINKTDLIDDPGVESDVHAQHAEVGEKDCVRGYFATPAVHRYPRRGWWGRQGRHHIPHVVVSGWQQQGAIGCVVDRNEDGTHAGVVEIVGSGQRVRVTGGLRVELPLVDDARVGHAGAISTHARRVGRPQCPPRECQPQRRGDAAEPIHLFPDEPVAHRQGNRDDRNGGKQAEHRREQDSAVHEIATLPNPVQGL